MKLTISRAWKPESGRAYGRVELTMADDFERADARLWGLVEATDLTQTTSFDLLRIVGRREWFPRFDVLNTPGTDDWRHALGGRGGPTALAGVHALGSKLRIRRLEVVGVPGAGIRYQLSRVRIDSALFDRTGWPVQGDQLSIPGSQLRGITSRDHWFSTKWGDTSWHRGVALRALETEAVAARGELVMNAANYVLEDYTHQGDGIAWKCSGTDFAIRRFHGGPAFLNGVVPANRTTYPDPILFRHLHEARGIVVEDSSFAGLPFAELQSRALLYVSYPFTEPPLFRGCTFVRGRHRFVAQCNWSAPRFEGCTFVGWADAADAFELSPAHDGMPPASIDLDPSCRFHAS